MKDFLDILHNNTFEVRRQHAMILKKFNRKELPYFDETDLMNELGGWFVGINPDTFNDELVRADEVCKDAKDWTPGLYRIKSYSRDDEKWVRYD